MKIWNTQEKSQINLLCYQIPANKKLSVSYKVNNVQTSRSFEFAPRLMDIS